MGKDTNQKAASPNGKAGRANPFSEQARQHDPAVIADVPGVLAIIDQVLEAGDGLILSRTRDGGAICVQLLTGDLRHKVYAGDQAELNQIFTDLFSAYKQAPLPF